jgi:RNA polymerase sigma factor (sigma-70 family)
MSDDQLAKLNALLERAQRGDAAAMTDLVNQLAGYLTTVVRVKARETVRLPRTSRTTSDFLQAALSRVLKRLKSLESARHLINAFRLALGRVLKDYLRRRKAAKRRHERVPLFEDLVDRRARPLIHGAAALHAGQLIDDDALVAALERIEQRNQGWHDVLMRYHFYEESSASIAADLRTSANAIDALLFRARAALRVYYDEYAGTARGES